MLKMLIPLIMLLPILNFNTFMILSSFMMMLLLLKTNFTSMMSPNSLTMMDNYSLPLIILSLMTLILIIISSSSYKSIFTLSYLIFITLIMTFSANKIMLFYIFFELSLIPTFILITKSGKQPERLQAALYLMLYMLLSSLPLLIGILMLSTYNNFSLATTLNMKLLFPMIFMLPFLAKLPMFMLHLWLPKAHVEAPVEGSMILAAILLKLGGYGLIRFLPFIFHKIYTFNKILISISLMGAIMTAMNCFRQKDLKALVAYSSISHMALLLSSLMTLNMLSLPGTMMMMVAHGLVSSGLFFLVDLTYKKYHSRTISIFKGINHIFPNLSFWWFILLMMNMAAPPSINTISEITLMSSILNWNMLSSIMIIISSMMITSFTVMMFSSLNHNMNKSNFMQNTMSKNYLSLFTHSSPLILMIMKSEVLF